MKRIFTTALLCVPGMLLAQEKPFKLSGKVGALEKPARAYLLYSYNSKTTLDSTDITAGNFVFSGKLEYPVTATVIISHDGKTMREMKGQDKLNIYLEPGERTMLPADSIARSGVKGSAINDAYVELRKALDPVEKERMTLYTRYSSATAEERQSDTFRKEMDAADEANDKAKKAIQLDFIQRHPNSIVSLHTIQDYGGAVPQYEMVQPLFEGLSKAIKTSVPGKKYSQYLVKISRTAIGKMAPEIALPDTAGNVIKLSSLKGKYVLIDFWASWCGPCRAENPAVVEAYNKYKSHGFEVLGVSLDKGPSKSAWIKAIKDDGLTWLQVSDLQYWKSPTAEEYGIRAIPQNFLLDPEGKIIAKNLRGEELDKKLKETFAM
ncbi:Peroxiredoxin [Chitinophaga sp. YR627]|uniref:redoxin domain-containing protein n=1 Tax=Chitinophaga sp. YR627 TaxID=1881041 RepID=UPI0008EB5B19|nr:redoxin domain-containing protein [Chitinophaga sp. YR627]SFN32776.1 Peroxiredoxin [Chitinophaga sp. YR627]